MRRDDKEETVGRESMIEPSIVSLEFFLGDYNVIICHHYHVFFFFNFYISSMTSTDLHSSLSTATIFSSFVVLFSCIFDDILFINGILDQPLQVFTPSFLLLLLLSVHYNNMSDPFFPDCFP